MTKLGSRSMKRHQSVTLSLLFLAGLVNFLDRSSLAIANTSIQSELHLSATQIGWLFTCFSVAYGVGQLPLIGLLDRTGTRIVLGMGLALWSLAQLLTGFVQTFPEFLIFRGLLGVGEAPFYPAGVRSVSEWFSAAGRGRATAIMSMSQTVGLAIAPPVLTILMIHVGWRTTFIILGVAGLIVAFAWIWLHRTRRSIESVHQAVPNVLPGAWKELLRQRTVWGMMLGFGGINYTSWLYISWLPGYLQASRGLTLTRTGWLASIPFVFGALGMISSGALSDRLATGKSPLTTVHRRNIVSGMIVSAASTVLVAHSDTTAAALAWISVALFSIHFAGTSGWGYVQTISPNSAVASLTALQNFSSFMIASAAPVLTGVLLDRTHSFSMALELCSGVTLLGALSYATLAAPDGMHMAKFAE